MRGNSFLIAYSGVLLLILGLSIRFSHATKITSRAERSISLNDVQQLLSERKNRLPKDVIATSYELEIEPRLAENKLKGRVKINVTWSEKGDQIVLNADPDMIIEDSDVRIVEINPNKTDPASLVVHIAEMGRLMKTNRNFFVIVLEHLMRVNESCTIDIKYTANLTSNGVGFFKEDYYLWKQERHDSFYATNLRLNYASTMFPCMDDPGYKATFKLNVKRSINDVARSNVPLEKITKIANEPNAVWHEFQKTPLMATYQLGLFISQFDGFASTLPVNKINGEQLDVQFWAPKEIVQLLKDKKVPEKIVMIYNYLQNYFNSSIGLPKLDIVAYPGHVGAEKSFDNWGIVYFTKEQLLKDHVWNIAYELIYQWIGQYITPKEWSDAPVNKALNSFLAAMTTSDLNPDELEGKWPITMLYSLYYEFGKVDPFSRVYGIRDDAKSAKTELLFRMFNYTLGKDNFRKAMRKFICAQSNGNRTFFERQIYNHLNDVANETKSLSKELDIYQISRVWIHRDRLPIVTVTRDYNAGNVTFSQNIYFRDGKPAAFESLTPGIVDIYQWSIPIVMLSENSLDFSKTKPLTWLTTGNGTKNQTIKDITDKDHFIIVNPEEIGMFPVNYDSCNWKMLSQFLQGPKRSTIPVLTRAKLLHDAWNLAYAGELCFSVALNMTLFLKEEKSHVVWEPVFTMIDHIGRRIENSYVYPKFEAYVRNLMTPLYTELGKIINETQAGEVPTNIHNWQVHMRGLIKNFLCRAGYQPCVKEAREQYKKWLEEEEPDSGIPIANEFICPVFKWGTIDEWEFGLQRVINFPLNDTARKENERTYLLKTLAGCPKDPYKIERLLNVTVLDQNENFTNSDIHLIFSTLSGGAAGYKTLFYFLQDNWDFVKEKFENKTFLWDGIINSATSSFNSQEGYDMVSDLYTVRFGEFESAESIIKKALKRIKQETEWGEKNLPIIDAWLKENLPEDDLKLIGEIKPLPLNKTIQAGGVFGLLKK
ncbi:aminopeptidase N [Prorops nasuta]|uniref:aminopeptidase N n=1 Tax=Prorops nasuta TaxID=863751 RepID=UPI0034CD4ADF